jgi:L-lactate utilization protein LutB
LFLVYFQKKKKKGNDYTYEENECTDLRAKFNDIRDKFYKFKAARSTPTHFSHTYTPHKSCSYCSNPYHCSSNCPSKGQLSNFLYEQLNTSYSNPGYDSNSSVYNSDWSNQSDFTWSAQTTRNYAPQFQELHYSNYPPFDHQAQPSAYQAAQLAPQSSLEEMMKAFMQSIDKNVQALTQSTDKFMQRTNQAVQSNSRDIQELNSYTTQAVARIEGQIGHLVTELNRIEEEELQSQLMIERH